MSRNTRIAFGLIASSLSLVAQAATQTVSTASYVVQYDDAYVSFANGVLTDLTAAAKGVSYDSSSISSNLSQAYVSGGTPEEFSGTVFSITAKNGVVLTGVTETFSGNLTQGASAQVYGGSSSLWGVFTAGSASANESTSTSVFATSLGAFSNSGSASFSGAKTLTLGAYGWGVGFLAGSGSVSGLSHTYTIQAVGNPSPVPEPTGVALALAGAGVVWLRRRVK